MTLLTEDQQVMVTAINQICSKFVTDEYSLQIDREARYPHEVMDALAEAGWAALPVSEDAGGGGATTRDLAIIYEALAKHNLVVGQAFFSLWALGAEVMERIGTDEQKAVWLPRMMSGAKVAFALTEPGSGSDAAALRMSAIRVGDDFLVNGSKVFITGAAISDLIVTAVRTENSGKKQEGISLLMVDPKAPGVEIRKLSKMGLKGLDLCEVFFTDVRVSLSEVLGGLNKGWQDLALGLAKERIALAALSVGALDDLLERCLEHAQNRESFGKPIASHQMIADKLVEMRIALESARALTLHAADLDDLGDPSAVELASMAKILATRSYAMATREAVQIFGGYGFTDEYPVSRHYRDCKYLEIGGGTSEIQKIIVARGMGIRL